MSVTDFPMSDCLTLAEVAKRLGKDHSTIARYVREGRLPGQWRGGAIWIPAKALEGFVPPRPGNPGVRKQVAS